MTYKEYKKAALESKPELRKEYDALAGQYNSCIDFLNSIPLPLYNQLAQRYQELQRFEREQQDRYEYEDDD